MLVRQVLYGDGQERVKQCTHQEDPLKPVGAHAHNVILCRCRIAVQGHDAVTVILYSPCH